MRNCDENLGGVGENIQCHKSMTQYCVFLVRVWIVEILILHITKKISSIPSATPLTYHHPPPLPLNLSQDIWGALTYIREAFKKISAYFQALSEKVGGGLRKW